jgi:hypothetical protein
MGGCQSSFELELLFLENVAQSSRSEHLPAVELDSQDINDLVSGILFSDSEDDSKDRKGNNRKRCPSDSNIMSDEDDAWN